MPAVLRIEELLLSHGELLIHTHKLLLSSDGVWGGNAGMLAVATGTGFVNAHGVAVTQGYSVGCGATPSRHGSSSDGLRARVVSEG